MIGSSYEGFTVVMALIDPHPALKVAAPESPTGRWRMVDHGVRLRRVPQINLDSPSAPDPQCGGRHGAFCG